MYEYEATYVVMTTAVYNNNSVNTNFLIDFCFVFLSIFLNYRMGRQDTPINNHWWGNTLEYCQVQLLLVASGLTRLLCRCVVPEEPLI